MRAINRLRPPLAAVRRRGDRHPAPQGGKGGRNSEFLLSFARHISGLPGLFSLAADTDGIDGSENNAGAFADGSSFDRMRAAGIDPALCLEHNDAYSALSTVGDVLVTGPTDTNVNDFRAILIGA